MRHLIFIVLIFQCTNSVFSQNSAIINIDIANSNKDSLSISISDNFYDISATYDIKSKINKKGHCQFIIKIDQPVYAMLHAGYNFGMFISPNDSITISYSDNDFINTAKVTGNRVFHYSYLIDYLKTFNESLGMWYDEGFSDIFIMSANDFKNHRKEKLTNDISFRDKYLSNATVSEEFKTFINSEIYYSYYNSILSYASFRKFFKNINDQIEPNFYNEINDSLFCYDKNLLSPMYKEALNSYIFQNLALKSKSTDSISLSGYYMAEKHLKNLTKQYLKGSIIYNKLKENRKSTINDSLIGLFKNEYPSISLTNFNDKRNKLQSEFTFVQDSIISSEVIFKSKETILIDTIERKIKFNDLLNSNKGFVIYIDFWRSTCGPCKLEMPYSADLIKRMEGKKVKFIYISTDDNSARWINAIHNWKIGEQNFRLMDSFDSELCKNLKVNSIPRYILIDKYGQLAYSFALRPSDSEITNQIEELINK